jgi:hypothetical protein
MGCWHLVAQIDYGACVAVKRFHTLKTLVVCRRVPPFQTQFQSKCLQPTPTELLTCPYRLRSCHLGPRKQTSHRPYSIERVLAALNELVKQSRNSG